MHLVYLYNFKWGDYFSNSNNTWFYCHSLFGLWAPNKSLLFSSRGLSISLTMPYLALRHQVIGLYSIFKNQITFCYSVLKDRMKCKNGTKHYWDGNGMILKQSSMPNTLKYISPNYFSPRLKNISSQAKQA